MQRFFHSLLNFGNWCQFFSSSCAEKSENNPECDTIDWKVSYEIIKLFRYAIPEWSMNWSFTCWKVSSDWASAARFFSLSKNSVSNDKKSLDLYALLLALCTCIVGKYWKISDFALFFSPLHNPHHSWTSDMKSQSISYQPAYFEVDLVGCEICARLENSRHVLAIQGLDMAPSKRDYLTCKEREFHVVISFRFVTNVSM